MGALLKRQAEQHRVSSYRRRSQTPAGRCGVSKLNRVTEQKHAVRFLCAVPSNAGPPAAQRRWGASG